jgi:hypothetical protein
MIGDRKSRCVVNALDHRDRYDDVHTFVELLACSSGGRLEM